MPTSKTQPRTRSEFANSWRLFKSPLAMCFSFGLLMAVIDCVAVLNIRSSSASPVVPDQPGAPALEAGFAEADITPALKEGKPVYLAGFGHNRKATGVHDPLKARAVVLRHAGRKVAFVSLDVVGLFDAPVARIRRQLPGFTYVLVTSTHNHEGPDTLGIWGPHPFASGIDADYLKRLEGQAAKAVRDADAAARPVTARIGTAQAPELLHDGREPYVKHDELVALRFDDPQTGKKAGLVVQWNCHPE